MNRREGNAYQYLFIIPTYNEVLVIERSLETVLSFLETKWTKRQASWRLVVADNGSTDGTAQKVAQIAQKHQCVQLVSVGERGRGRAIQKVLTEYPATYYCYIDADIPVDVAALEDIFMPLTEGVADLVIGRRIGKRPLARKILTAGLYVLNCLFWKTPVHDSQCGFKVFNATVAQVILSTCRENGWFLDTELVAYADTEHYRVAEIPVRWIERRFEKRESKVRFFHDAAEGLRAFYRIVKRVYPSFLKDISILALSGISMFVLYGVAAFSMVRSSLYTIEGESRFYYFLIGAALLYVVVSAAVTTIRSLPHRCALVVLVFCFMLIGGAALFTWPTGSQDMYWNLLMSKGLTHYHLNPYATPVSMLASDPWHAPIRSWGGLSMLYGPLWVMLLVPVTFATSSLLLALAYLKVFFFFCLLCSGFIFWKIMNVYQIEKSRRVVLLALLAFNPFIIQTTLVDGHNDTIMLVLILLGYYCFLAKKYGTSIVVFALGAFIKYTPALLILLPLYYAYMDTDISKRKKWIRVGGAFLIVGILCVALYAPFGFRSDNMTGVADELVFRGGIVTPFSAPGALVLQLLTPLSAGAIRIIGILATFFICLFFLKRKPLSAVIYPYIGLFFMLPWFQPWYMLWIFPLFLIAVPLDVFVLTSLFLIFVPEGLPAYAGAAIPVWVLVRTYAPVLLSAIRKRRAILMRARS